MKNRSMKAFGAALALLAISYEGAGADDSAATAQAASARPSDDPVSWAGESGIASYYSSAFHGLKTSSGARFNKDALTAAHPWLPFGTKVRVILGDTGRSVIVTITDRMYSHRRVVDLSLAAARQLGIIRRGIAEVSLYPV